MFSLMTVDLIMRKWTRDVSSIRSLKSRKYHKFILNLLISRLAQSRDPEKVGAVIDEFSRVSMVAA